jgi:phenylpropionate dioxygenase-like ring-hydroxylating dioxygenase large terminal subunit
LRNGKEVSIANGKGARLTFDRESGTVTMRTRTIHEIVDGYNPRIPLAEASTPPAPWYTDPRILELERRTVFARSWQVVGRTAQVVEPGQYITSEIAGEPIVVVRGRDGILRGFFNVCRHHAAVVMTDVEGRTQRLRCPYHGWTYSLEGELEGTPDFAGVCNFDRTTSGLVSVETAVWEGWVFVKVEAGGPTLQAFLGGDAVGWMRGRGVKNLHWLERRRYELDCNWKVYVDNYLDGGYHVPSLHRGLDSILDYSQYHSEIGGRVCLQSSPIMSEGADARTRAVRSGERAFYYWVYPNFMINCYEGKMDTNLVFPLAVERTEVIFDYYFADVSKDAREHNLASISVSERIQDEDVAICRSVQCGLHSRSYTAGRLSLRREAGEHLFHKLLYADLKAGMERGEG